MDDFSNIQCPHVRIRVFRAIDDPDTCLKFIEGHAAVLSSIGIKKVTSSKYQWAENPAVFVLVVESTDGKRVFGGARIHVAGGNEYLPIEEALTKLDPSIHAVVWQHAQHGSGEICGLWNSKDMAGYGLGSPLLIRSGIAIASQLGIKSLFALCAPYTVQPVVYCGMTLVENVGNKGTFYYPKLDLIATAMVLNDVNTLSKATEQDRNEVFDLRSHLDGLRVTESKKKPITIDFNLRIPHLDRWDLNAEINAAQINFSTLKLA